MDNWHGCRKAANGLMSLADRALGDGKYDCEMIVGMFRKDGSLNKADFKIFDGRADIGAIAAAADSKYKENVQHDHFDAGDSKSAIVKLLLKRNPSDEYGILENGKFNGNINWSVSSPSEGEIAEQVPTLEKYAKNLVEWCAVLLSDVVKEALRKSYMINCDEKLLENFNRGHLSVFDQTYETWREITHDMSGLGEWSKGQATMKISLNQLQEDMTVGADIQFNCGHKYFDASADLKDRWNISCPWMTAQFDASQVEKLRDGDPRMLDRIVFGFAADHGSAMEGASFLKKAGDFRASWGI